MAESIGSLQVKTAALRLLVAELRRENSDLRKEKAELKRKNAALTSRVNAANPFVGARVEQYITDQIGGQLTAGHAAYDVRGPRGHRLEVKFSRINKPHDRAVAHRWSWGQPLGVGGRKVFDRLILIGETDPQYRSDYREPRSVYVLFDIPFKSVRRLMRNNKYIQSSSNPNASVGETGRELFRRFHVDRATLRRRYGLVNSAG